MLLKHSAEQTKVVSEKNKKYHIWCQQCKIPVRDAARFKQMTSYKPGTECITKLMYILIG